MVFVFPLRKPAAFPERGGESRVDNLALAFAISWPGLYRRSGAGSLDHYRLHFGTLRPQTMIDTRRPDDALSGPKARDLLADRDEPFATNTDHGAECSSMLASGEN